MITWVTIGFALFAGLLALGSELMRAKRLGVQPREREANFMVAMHQVGFTIGTVVAVLW